MFTSHYNHLPVADSTSNGSLVGKCRQGLKLVLILGPQKMTNVYRFPIPPKLLTNIYLLNPFLTITYINPYYSTLQGPGAYFRKGDMGDRPPLWDRNKISIIYA